MLHIKIKYPVVIGNHACTVTVVVHGVKEGVAQVRSHPAILLNYHGLNYIGIISNGFP